MSARRIGSQHATTGLERFALRWLNAKGRDYDNGAAGAARDLFYGGCSSGIVSELIYNSDCERFAKRYLTDILAVMADLTDSMGESPKPDEDRGQSWDATWLAWLGFEEAARTVCSRAGIES